MNKPGWKDAPEWANWLAMDLDGEWGWHELKPTRKETFWVSAGRAFSAANHHNKGWGESLEERSRDEG